MEKSASILRQCYHCGQEIHTSSYSFHDKEFCCSGCQNVYQVLSENGLCSYYAYNDSPGQSRSGEKKQTRYLDEPKVISRLVDFTDDKTTIITLYIPAIHCSSCIWLLEHLHKVNNAVVHSRIDFLKKEVCITFRHQELSLKKLVELLDGLGYEPLITPKVEEPDKKRPEEQAGLLKKIALAGFCLGNVMLFSFPEYLGLSHHEQNFRILFGWLNLLLILPVTFYCAQDFFVSAWGGLKKGFINLDAPLALIISVLFIRSVFEIVTRYGPGFSDTLTGLIFLLLLGRWVKQRAYQHFSFQRDYRSYFPMAVSVIRDNQEQMLVTEDLKAGDRMLIRNNEIIPADSLLIKGQAYINFSFVTGESALAFKSPGDMIYAGGKQQGEALELEVIKPVSQSYLTSLWNNEVFGINKSRIQTFNDSVARYFGTAALSIAALSASFWLLQHETTRAWEAFTAVLIVACPCVLALSSPFILSAVLTVFDKYDFHLRNTDVIEQLAKTETIVFDKTGTLTSPDQFDLSFSGCLSAEDKIMLSSLARNSNHPLSRSLVKWLGQTRYFETDYFSELPGKGISGFVKGSKIVAGNAAMVQTDPGRAHSSCLYVQIDDVILGRFTVGMKYRDKLASLLKHLGKTCSLHLLSGDNDSESTRLDSWFAAAHMRFFMSPQQKLDYVKDLQEKGHTVTMIGDGLNDAGALRQSDTGIAISDQINNFSPACDAVLKGSSLQRLPRFIGLARDGVRTVRRSFVIAASYNLVGLYFAVQGTMSPLTAAVLMPLSTLTILTFGSVSIRHFIRKHRLQ